MIGPAIPQHLLDKLNTSENDKEDEESSDDDYGPSLPPDLAPKPITSNGRTSVSPPHPTRNPITHLHNANAYEYDEDDDVVGPMPLPEGFVEGDADGVREFVEREERRRQNIEENNKPKAPKRDEWMLVPPEASSLLGTLDPTKLKARQFSRNTEEKSKDRTLWTETPAERQTRLAEEVMGKRKRPEGASGSSRNNDMDDRDRKRLHREEKIKEEIERHNRKNRGHTLVEMHQTTASASQKEDDQSKPPPQVWDRDRDMAVVGRLMDDSSRQKAIKDAKGLVDRFGKSSRGGYL